MFTKLDCNSGFHQKPRHPDRQEPTVRRLLPSLHRSGNTATNACRLVSAQDQRLFLGEMACILQEIPGIIGDIGDVSVFERYQQEHDDRLKLVLQKIKEASVTLNEKCKFSHDSVKFLGHMISKEGIRMDPEKVQAISRFRRPVNISELRHILGMVNNVGKKYASHMADTTKTMRDLLKKETDWIWEEPQEKALKTNK